MKDEKSELAWRLLAELRKETIEAQRIRAQVIGFKVTFVSAGVGLIVANIDKVPGQLLVIPAFASIFFDFLINSYSISIKRIGVYCRCYLEPILRTGVKWPEDILLWEEFMSRPQAKQRFSIFGNLGISILAAAVGIWSLFYPFQLFLSLSLLLILVLLLVLDVWSHLVPRWITERGFENSK